MTQEDVVLELILSKHGLIALLDDPIGSLLINEKQAAKLLFHGSVQQQMTNYECLVLSSFYENMDLYLRLSTLPDDRLFDDEMEFMLRSERMLCQFLRSAFVCGLSALPMLLRERRGIRDAYVRFLEPLRSLTAMAQDRKANPARVLWAALEDDRLPLDLRSKIESRAPQVLKAMAARMASTRDKELLGLDDEALALYCALLRTMTDTIRALGDEAVTAELNRRRLQILKRDDLTSGRAYRATEKYLRSLRLKAGLAEDADPEAILRAAADLPLTKNQRAKLGHVIGIWDTQKEQAAAPGYGRQRDLFLMTPAQRGAEGYLRELGQGDALYEIEDSQP